MAHRKLISFPFYSISDSLHAQLEGLSLVDRASHLLRRLPFSQKDVLAQKMSGSGQMGMSRIFPRLLNLRTLNPRKLGSSSLMLVVKLPHSLPSFLALQRLVRSRVNTVGLITCGVPALSRFLRTTPSRRS